MLAALAASSTHEAGRSRRCQTCASLQASCVWCLHAPYRAIGHRSIPPEELSRRETCCSAPTAVLHCCTALRLRSLFAFLLSASPVRIAAECPPSVRARLTASVIGGTLQFPAILQYLVASEICSGNWDKASRQDCAIFLLLLRSNPWEWKKQLRPPAAAAFACTELIARPKVLYSTATGVQSAVRAITACF